MTELLLATYYTCDDRFLTRKYVSFVLHEDDFQSHVYEQFFFNKLKDWYKNSGSYDYEEMISLILLKYRNIQLCDTRPTNCRLIFENDDRLYNKITEFLEQDAINKKLPLCHAKSLVEEN